MDLLHKDDEYVLARFSCLCLAPEDCLDVLIEYNPTTVNLTINNMPRNWKDKLRLIWRVIRDQKITWQDIILRPEDTKELINILKLADRKVCDINEK